VNGLRVEHACPQCGAPVTLEETDRLVECPFCRVRSYLVAEDVFRYVLPHKGNGHDLLYFPYWRFRGTVFSCRLLGVDHRVVDTNRQARESPWFPPSLGVRPQAMTLRFADAEQGGRFLPPVLSRRQATQALARATHVDNTRSFHQDFIGETTSILYAPFYLNGKVFDAVLDRASSPPIPEGAELDAGARQTPEGGMRFLPTLCPHCGWDLEGERDSIVLFCRHCARGWTSGTGTLEELAVRVLELETRTPPLFLPFWRIRVRVSGMPLASYADFVRAANLPFMVHPEWRDRLPCFWIPAFKIRPAIFLRLATTFSVAGRVVEDVWEAGPDAGEDDPQRALPDRPIHPVNLPRSEAADSVKVILGSLLLPRAHWLPQLTDTTVAAESAELVLIPFEERGSEILQPGMPVSINRAALAFGRQL
jgi:hypothetical protein